MQKHLYAYLDLGLSLLSPFASLPDAPRRVSFDLSMFKDGLLTRPFPRNTRNIFYIRACVYRTKMNSRCTNYFYYIKKTSACLSLPYRFVPIICILLGRIKLPKAIYKWAFVVCLVFVVLGSSLTYVF